MRLLRLRLFIPNFYHIILEVLMLLLFAVSFIYMLILVIFYTFTLLIHTIAFRQTLKECPGVPEHCHQTPNLGRDWCVFYQPRKDDRHSEPEYTKISVSLSICELNNLLKVITRSGIGSNPSPMVPQSNALTTGPPRLTVQQAFSGYITARWQHQLHCAQPPADEWHHLAPFFSRFHP